MSSTTHILLIAHAPLAHALRACVLHVFPDRGDQISALDIPANEAPEDSLLRAQSLLDRCGSVGTLVLADVFGATPCNVAQRLVEGTGSRLVAGVNLPMLLRAVGYLDEPLDVVAARAVAGGTQGILQVAVSAPQNQNRLHRNDQDPYDHQQ